MNDLMKSIETLSEEAKKHGKAPSSTINPDAQAETMLSNPSEAAVQLAQTQGREFESIELLGEGGMGRVELMRQRSLQREVAAKSVKPSKRSAHSYASLLKEAIFTGSLEHPNIVPVHIVALDEDNNPLIVMKRVEGISLRELLQQPAHPLWGSTDRLTRVIEILMQVCNAIYFAHTRGILHRDIKPENIMLGHYGEVYLVDWGVAIPLSEAAEARGLAGTPSYMAPESVNGEPLGAQTDLYLLGGCLYEALSGHPPHPGDSLRQVLLAAAEGGIPPLPPGTPKELAQLCLKALQRRPEDRYESAPELREALGLFLRHQGAVRLTQEALSLLQEARASQEARRLLLESRFGLRQALREWPESAEASAAMEQCIRQLFALELVERNVNAAELLLAELRSPAPELHAQLKELKRQREEEGQAKTRLARLEREQDLKISNTARTLLALLFTISNLAVTYYFATHLTLVTLQDALLISLVIAIVAIVVFFFGRRAFFKNKINQQLSSSILLLTFGLAIHRLMSLYLERPLEQMFLEEAFFFSLSLSVVGIFYQRYLLFTGLIFLGLSFASAMYPGYASLLLGLLLGVPFLGMILEWGQLHKVEGERA